MISDSTGTTDGTIRIFGAPGVETPKIIALITDGTCAHQIPAIRNERIQASLYW